MTLQESAQAGRWDSSCRRDVLRLVSTPPVRGDAEPEGLVDGLVEAVEQLDRAAEEGWRLVSVRLLRDARGEYQLDARLARQVPLPGTVSPLASASVGKAA